MAACSTKTGRKKSKWRREFQAWEEAERLTQRYEKEFQAYFCYVCFNWHVGSKRRGSQTHEEALVGKLIKVIKDTINRQALQ